MHRVRIGIAGIGLAAALLAGSGCAPDSGKSATVDNGVDGTRAGAGQLSASPTPPATSSAPDAIAVPDVVGVNAAVAKDQLKALGFTNISLGTVDGRPLVVLPQNWVVRSQSAAAGTRLAPAVKIVLGCAKIE